MNLTLKIKVEGKKERQDKKFITKFIPAQLFKETLTLVKEFDGISEEELMNNTDFSDKIAQYIVNTFDEQFTLDELYKGMDISEMIPKFQECAQTVMEKFGNKSAELAKLSPNK